MCCCRAEDSNNGVCGRWERDGDGAVMTVSTITQLVPRLRVKLDMLPRTSLAASVQVQNRAEWLLCVFSVHSPSWWYLLRNHLFSNDFSQHLVHSFLFTVTANALSRITRRNPTATHDHDAHPRVPPLS